MSGEASASRYARYGERNQCAPPLNLCFCNAVVVTLGLERFAVADIHANVTVFPQPHPRQFWPMGDGSFHVGGPKSAIRALIRPAIQPVHGLAVFLCTIVAFDKPDIIGALFSGGTIRQIAAHAVFRVSFRVLPGLTGKQRLRASIAAGAVPIGLPYPCVGSGYQPQIGF